MTLFICLITISISAYGQSEPIKSYTEQSSKHNFRTFLYAGGLIGSAIFLDHPTQEWAHRLLVKGGSRALDGADFGHDGTLIERLGRGEVDLGLSSLFYLTGVIGGSEKSRRVGFIGTEAILTSGVLATGIKTIIGRQRPEFQNDSDQFRFLKGAKFKNGSFPSGHTTTAFALASVTAKEYNSTWVSFVSYGLATTVGFSRIYQNKHWVTDVVGGAALGIGVGKGLYNLEMKKKWGINLYSDGSGLFIRKKF